MAGTSSSATGGKSANENTLSTEVSAGQNITNYNTGTDTPPWISLAPFQAAGEMPKWIYYAGGALVLVVLFLIFRRK